MLLGWSGRSGHVLLGSLPRSGWFIGAFVCLLLLIDLVVRPTLSFSDFRVVFFFPATTVTATLKRHDDIARCNKGNSAIFIPNVIVVQDKSGKVQR